MSSQSSSSSSSASPRRSDAEPPNAAMEAEERRKRMEKLERKIAKAEMKMAEQFLRKQRKKKKAKKPRKEASDDESSDEEQEEEAQEEVVKKKPKAGRGRGKKRASELPEEEASGLADSAAPPEGSVAEAAAEAPAKASQRGTKGKTKKRAKESREDAEADSLQGAERDMPNDEASGMEKVPKRGRRSKKTAEEAEAAKEDLGGDSQLQGDEKEKPDNEASGLEKTGKRGRRGKKADEGTIEKEDSQVGEAGEAAQSSQGQGRRGKKARGEDGGKPAREEGIDALLDWGEDLEEADEAVLQDWQQELAQRRDSGSSDDRTAFSMRERGSMLRSLKPECFLGGRRLEEGGHLLYDDEGKVNLHFLLATVKTATASASGALSALRPASAHRAKLRWLASLALEMRLIGKLEVKRGKVQQKRMEQARKNGNFSLLLESNLVTERRAEDAKEATRANAASTTRTFPERAPVEGTNDYRAGRQTVFSSLRSQAERRQAKIVTNSSHHLDLNKMQALIGPTFSFDWEAKGEGEEDELEVDIPESDKRSSGRNILKDQLQRSVSFRQLKSIHSSQSLGVSTTSTPTASQDVADTLLAPPPALSGELARRVARRGEEPSEAAPKASIDSPALAATEVSCREAQLPATAGTVAGLQEEQTPTDRLADKVAEPNCMEGEKHDLPQLPSTSSAGADPHLCATQPLPEEEEKPPAEEVAEAEEEQPVERPAAHDDAEEQKEVVISPTLPFEPAIPPPELAPPPVRKATHVPLEISPTLPFEPQVAEPEEEPPSRAGAMEPNASAKHATTARSAQGASDLEDSALLDNEIEDLMEDEDHEADTESDRRRACQEREWLKHKRRLELQSRAASNDQSALKKQAVAGKNGLGTSSMSAEEKSRYQALVSDVPQPAAEVNDAFLGTNRSTLAAPAALQRKPSFVALLAKKFLLTDL